MPENIVQSEVNNGSVVEKSFKILLKKKLLVSPVSSCNAPPQQESCVTRQKQLRGRLRNCRLIVQ